MFDRVLSPNLFKTNPIKKPQSFKNTEFVTISSFIVRISCFMVYKRIE